MNSMDRKEEWTIQEFLDKYDRLGLPHFQRGHVWNSDTVSLLLESLFYDTPCGSIILWKPQDIDTTGIPLPGATNIEYLLIDGQQRIRSIHDALHDIMSDEEQQNDEKSVWCLNIASLPELFDFFSESHLLDRPLFMKVTDPTSDRSNPRYRNDLIPLAFLMREQDREKPVLWDNISTKPYQVRLLLSDKINIRKRIREICTRSLYVIIKEEREGKNTLPDMVQLYNRINSGGMRVQAEERAFASLVSLYPGTNDWLQKLYETIHRKSAVDNQDTLGRDEVLQRKRERSFGFRLFIRAFIQAASFHFHYSIGSNGLSFNVIESSSFHSALNTCDQKKVDKLFKHAREVLINTQNVLNSELYCDSFPFLPETGCLVPVFQFFLKYRVGEDIELPYTHRKIAALLILKLVLNKFQQREVFRYANMIERSNCLEQCAHICKKMPAPSQTKLNEQLKYSNSLYDRMVLLLYWLERKHEIKDFSYSQLSDKKQERLKPGHEKVICEQVNPEKQHIIPYSEIREVYGLQDSKRISSHEINNIGNLTYISQDLNSFEKGVGPEFIILSANNSDVLKAHYLNDPELLYKYNEICSLLAERKIGGNQNDARIKKAFTFFCKRRRELIAKGFLDWLSDIECESVVHEEIEERTEPETRIFEPSARDYIRRYDYPNTIEDCLLRIVTTDRVTPDYSKTQNGEKAISRLRIFTRRPEKKAVFIDLDLYIDHLILRFQKPDHLSIQDLKEKASDCNVTENTYRLSITEDEIQLSADLLKSLFNIL